MPDKILSIIDPLETLNVKTDTTLALMAEAHTRGADNFVAELKDIFLVNGTVHFHATPVTLKPGYTKPPLPDGPKQVYSADDFKVILMRKDPPVDEHFMTILFMLRCHDHQKTLVVNNPDGILVANEKLFGLKIASNYYPTTLVSCNKNDIKAFRKQYKKIVLKPLFGAGGNGVMVFDEEDANFNAGLELLTNNFSKPVMVQSYIINAYLGDKRILLLNGEPLGAVLRVPQKGDYRANFHAGGEPMATEISDKERELCHHLKPHLVRLGLYFVGIDVIDNHLTEINVTSPTCILQMPGNLSAQVVDFML